MTANGETASWWGRRLATWPWRIGLGIPLLAGAILALGVVISLTSGGYEPPETLNAGRVEDFAVGAPKLYEEEDIWLVRLSEREFVALYDRGLGSGCPLQWRQDFDFLARRGWFVDACTGYAYDLAGHCFSEACRGLPLDRFAVRNVGDNVIVDLQQLLLIDATAGTADEPISPQAE